VRRHSTILAVMGLAMLPTTAIANEFYQYTATGPAANQDGSRATIEMVSTQRFLPANDFVIESVEATGTSAVGQIRLLQIGFIQETDAADECYTGSGTYRYFTEEVSDEQNGVAHCTPLSVAGLGAHHLFSVLRVSVTSSTYNAFLDGSQVGDTVAFRDQDRLLAGGEVLFGDRGNEPIFGWYGPRSPNDGRLPWQLFVPASASWMTVQSAPLVPRNDDPTHQFINWQQCGTFNSGWSIKHDLGACQ
jgi:hypothetical protein